MYEFQETPCWIEIQLNRALQLLDEVLHSMSSISWCEISAPDVGLSKIRVLWTVILQFNYHVSSIRPQYLNRTSRVYLCGIPLLQCVKREFLHEKRGKQKACKVNSYTFWVYLKQHTLMASRVIHCKSCMVVCWPRRFVCFNGKFWRVVFVRDTNRESCSAFLTANAYIVSS